jgi:Na+-translocating ferredoxin:NAD+ oxidoreductase RnfA subunit
LVFTALKIQNFLIVAGLLIVSMYVQMGEFLVKKLSPLFYTQTKYLVPSLVSTLFIVIVCAFASTTSFLELVTLVLFECVGILLVLVIIAGIRNSGSIDNKPALLKGNLVSLIILLFIMMAWTAF